MKKFFWMLLFFMSTLTNAALAGSNAPLGFLILCLKAPQECRGGGDAKITLTEEILTTIEQVNSRVNRSIKPKPDDDVDMWSVGVSAGDCEDYVLTKRRALIRAGLPASSLRIARTRTRSGESHAILVVKTDGQDLVLDNLASKVKPLKSTGYRIISISGANPREWS